MKIFAILLFVMGIVSMVLNLIILNKVKDTCKDDTTVKNSNYVNTAISGLLMLLGGGLFFYAEDKELAFAFG